MKTKRLRTLLVAGFLSLVPAVTLTSCGGGGGGGGGGGETQQSAPSLLNGKTAVLWFGDGTQRITFNGNTSSVSSVWNGADGRTEGTQGTFSWEAEQDGTYAADVHLSNGEEWLICFAVENGRLEGTYAEFNGKLVPGGVHFE